MSLCKIVNYLSHHTYQNESTLSQNALFPLLGLWVCTHTEKRCSITYQTIPRYIKNTKYKLTLSLIVMSAPSCCNN